MTEWAIAIQSLRDLSLVQRPWERFDYQNEVEKDLQDLFFLVWKELGGEGRLPQRLHYGSEFCQYRLPSFTEVRKAALYSWENGMDFTFATSYLHEKKFQELDKILQGLASLSEEYGKPIEIVVNDWGVYYHLRSHYPQFNLVMGRMLNKMIRDPRVASFYNQDEVAAAAEAGKRVMQGTGLFSSWFGRFLEEGNLTGIEFDPLLQDMDLTGCPENWHISFHFPFGCVASGSACMVGFMDAEKKDKFRGDPSCKHQCQTAVFELKPRTFGDMESRVFQKGNTAFFAHQHELIERGLHNATTISGSRVVYSPRIPV